MILSVQIVAEFPWKKFNRFFRQSPKANNENEEHVEKLTIIVKNECVQKKNENLLAFFLRHFMK